MKKGIVLGIIVILSGIFLIINNIGFIPDFITLRVLSWQSLLITLGLVFLVDKKIIVGITLMIIGACYLLIDILQATADIISPVICLIVGMVILILSIRHKKNKCWRLFDKKKFSEIPIDGKELLHKDYIFANSKEKWTCHTLKNVEISTVFSNVKLDLTQTKLVEEKTIIKVNSVFSEITFYVPSNWDIDVRQNGVFNRLVDKRPQNNNRSSDKEKILLEIEMVFSSGEIKCY